MAGLIRAALATLISPPAPVVDLLRGLRFRGRGLVELDLAGQLALGRVGGAARVCQALEWMRVDPMVRALHLRLDGTHGSWARMQEWRVQLRRLVEAGKPVFTELVAASDADLYLASAATRVFMFPLGDLQAGGLAASLLFLGDALQRLGVDVELLAAGDYKSAGERLTRSCPSPENREAMQALLADLHEQLVEGIAAGRAVDPQQVEAALACVPLSADDALEMGLVDELAYADQVEERIREILEFTPVELSFGAYWLWMRFRDLWRRLAGQGAPVAVLRLKGPVVSRRPQTGGREVIAADRVVTQLDRLRLRRDVHGVLITVDTGGGGVLASEQIWRAVVQLQEEKPVVALFQGVAASGGYYLAVPASTIFAQPGTITGSIGVIGARLRLHRLMERFGVHATTLRTAPSADMHAPFRALSAPERRRLEAHIARYYEVFLDRVVAGRRKPRRAVEPVARGRVWSGRAAREHGLLDRLGTYHDALRHLYQQVGVPLAPWTMPRLDLARSSGSSVRRLLRSALGWLPRFRARFPTLGALERVASRLELPAALELLAEHADSARFEPLALMEWEQDRG